MLLDVAESAARKAAQARISPISPRMAELGPRTPVSQAAHQAPYRWAGH